MRTLKVVFGVLLIAAMATAAQGTASMVVVGSARQVGEVKVESMSADAVPQHMNVQGYLTDASGNPINGSRSIRFDIYRGSSVWNETQNVDVANGLFSVILGSVTPIPYSVFEPGTTCELELTVESQTLSPRVEITSTGFAYRSVKSDTAVYSLASAGGDNAWVRSGSDSVLYTINNLGIAKGGASNLLYGSNRFTHVNLGVSCTTGTTGMNDAYATVGGGGRNLARRQCATVGGGWGNSASGDSSTVSGGCSNSASGVCATVGGGLFNSASGLRSVVVGGWADSAKGDYSVAAGEQCEASGNYSTVAGGSDNVASANYATVGGGNDNVASASYAVVSGGNDNVAAGQYSSVLGGAYDTVMGPYSAAFGRSAYIFAADSAIVLFDSVTHGVIRINADGRGNGGAFGASPIWVGYSAHNGNGAQLTAGGVWTNGFLNAGPLTSAPLAPGQVLDKVKSLPVMRLETPENNEVHITPTVDEFYAAFGCGTPRVKGTTEGRGGIAALDVAGVSLAAVQELLRQVEEQQAKIADLEARVARLEQR